MANIRKIDRLGYENWLNDFDWNFFCTFTTRYELTLKSTRRLMDRFHQGVKAYAGEASLFWIAEPFELKDGFHAHGLLSVPDEMHEPMHFKNICDIYQIKSGMKIESNDQGALKFVEYNRIDLKKYDRRRNAGRYATKYILKTQIGKGDYDLLI